MISDTIQKQITDAMKAKDSVRVSTLKLLSSELHNFKIDKPEMTAEDELKVVKSEVKKRTDAIEVYEKAGQSERVESEKQELVILKEFLPEQMGSADVETIIDEVLRTTENASMQDMGRIIGVVMQKTQGMADGKMVSEIVKAKLNAQSSG